MLKKLRSPKPSGKPAHRAKTKSTSLRKRSVREKENEDKPSAESTIVTSILAIRNEFGRIETRHREALYEKVGDVFAIAYRLRDDTDAWAELCRSDLWDQYPERWRPNLGKQNTATLLSVIRLAVGPDDKVRDRITKWSKGLQPAFDQEVQPQALPQYIKAQGGLEAMYRDRLNNTKDAAPTYTDDTLTIQIPAGKIADKISEMPAGRRILLVVRLVKLEDGSMSAKPVMTLRYRDPIVK